MNQKKLAGYKPRASVHTLQIENRGANINISDAAMPFINSSVIHKRETESGTRFTTSTVINPNHGSSGDCMGFSQFCRVLDTVVDGIGASKFRTSRCDLRIDTYSQNDYKRFGKLHRYLVSAVAETYKVENCYRTVDLFGEKQLSVAIKGAGFECEAYNRERKSALTGNKTETATSRFEIRTTGKGWRAYTMDGIESNVDAMRHEFCTHWIKRLRKSTTPEKLKQVRQRYNNELLADYQQSKDDLTTFLCINRDRFFTSKQMSDFLDAIGYQGNSREKVRNFKKRKGIEFFSDRDIKTAVDEIERAIQGFFDA